MIVELPGNSARFADVPAGTFFAFWRKSERLHGLTVTEGTATSAIMFFDNGRGYPWLAVGGLPNDQILAFPEAVLRPDISSAIDVVQALVQVRSSVCQAAPTCMQ